jgi:hypothetical protein
MLGHRNGLVLKWLCVNVDFSFFSKKNFLSNFFFNLKGSAEGSVNHPLIKTWF